MAQLFSANNPKLRKIVSFTLPTYLSGIISLLLFPLIATLLGPREYGRLDLLLMLSTVMNFALHLGWGSAHNRYYLEPDVSRQNLIRTLLVSRLGIFILAVIVTGALHDNILQWVNTDPSQGYLIWFVVASFMLTDLLNFHLQRYRMTNEAKKYLILQSSIALIYPLILLPSLWLFARTPAVVIVSLFATHLATLAVAWTVDSDWLFNGGRFDWKLLKRVFRFGMPLVPAALAVLGIQTIDRAMLNTLTDDATLALVLVGQFAFALRIVSFINLGSAGFRVLWGPYVMRTYKNEGSDVIYRDIFGAYLLISFALVMILVPLSLVLVPSFLPDYTDSIPVLCLLLAAAVIYVIGDYFCIGITIAEKNLIRTYAGFLSLAMNFFLNFILIPEFGTKGAATATLASTVVYSSVLLLYSHRYYPVAYPFKVFALASSLLVATVAFPYIELVYVFVMASLSLTAVFLLLGKSTLRAVKAVLGGPEKAAS